MVQLKLIITKNDNKTWTETIIDLNRNEVIFEYSGIPFDDESKEYFDTVEAKLKAMYNDTIVEVERFI
jgi:hypothetical protein